MRRRTEPHTFEQRLREQRLRLEREFATRPIGKQRDAVAVRIDQLRAAADMYEFLSLRETAQ
ncbi:hypothetical protein [Bradyrhizobium sp.]|uniref:hypothetical protein n=1 Tax=Bradyrhizobium sp. TaxID=376 RepID=UPI0023A3701F|nr:hypothetical protein [Bradyrhizobium sp.]MDE2378647.1 hypothetical protein [Bradyrhizobium sp.]